MAKTQLKNNVVIKNYFVAALGFLFYGHLIVFKHCQNISKEQFVDDRCSN